MYGTAMSIAAFFRPILSAIMPHGKAPTMAPIAKNEAIHGSSDSVAWTTESGLFSFSPTGDVHASPVPAAAAPRQTVSKMQNNGKILAIMICLPKKSERFFFFSFLFSYFVYYFSFPFTILCHQAKKKRPVMLFNGEKKSLTNCYLINDPQKAANYC